MVNNAAGFVLLSLLLLLRDSRPQEEWGMGDMGDTQQDSLTSMGSMGEGVVGEMNTDATFSDQYTQQEHNAAMPGMFDEQMPVMNDMMETEQWADYDTQNWFDYDTHKVTYAGSDPQP